MKLGTILPSRMTFSIVEPYYDCGLDFYSLKSYPADKCLNLNFCCIRLDWVPLPEPGPPRTKTTLNLLIIFNS